jgi:hypothetical protein
MKAQSLKKARAKEKHVATRELDRLDFFLVSYLLVKNSSQNQLRYDA